MSSIFAQSSAPGKAGVSVFRISGPEVLNIITQLADIKNPTPRYMYFATLRNPNNGEQIDEVLLCYFKGPASFTGEDVVEIHSHGSIAVAKLLTKVVLQFDNVRYAEAGEFAKRAFLNGKIDLTRAEAMVDLIEAETQMQHSQAMRQLSGELETLYSKWRQSLLKIMALLEAYIDFPEEEIPETVLDDAKQTITSLQEIITDHLNDNRRGERLRSGLHMALLGHPNVGKSSLMNLLTMREISIVSEISGTTRDTIESHLDIGGYPIILMDTAGLAEATDDVIELEGVKRAKNAALNADIKVIMIDASKALTMPEYLVDITCDQSTILVLNKTDLLPKHITLQDIEQKIYSDLKLNVKNDNIIYFSAKHKTGVEALLTAIGNAAEKLARPSEQLSLTRERHRHAVENALKALIEVNLDGDLVLAAEDIRIAAQYLSMLTGKIDVDEVLGEIFSSFCIGK